MIGFLLSAAQVLTPTPSAVQIYQQCLTPIVSENDRRSERGYLALGKLFAKIKLQCVNERTAAKEALATSVAARVKAEEGRTLPPDDAWKEELINDATIRWMSNATAESLQKVVN